MKKTILMGIAALLICGTVNATSWRVCSKPEAGANFTSVAAAVASNLVFAGDTLYLEPGHYEENTVNITKKLVIIGPGYFFEENGINAANPGEAVFGRGFNMSKGVTVIGCKSNYNINLSDSTTLDRCALYKGDWGYAISGADVDNVMVKNCFIFGNIHYYNGNGRGPSYNNIFQNNIIHGSFYDDYNNCYSFTIKNNTIVADYVSTNPIEMVKAFQNSEIYNNIIINMTSEYRINVVNQVSDTIYYAQYALQYFATNNVHHNILSNSPNNNFLNCAFNASVENVLIWNNANTFEEKYKHIANGPAVGAGVNGTTCGAYGAVSGGRAYQPAGIPQYRPYIYDANIDDTPSTNNTINASFKIKVQQ